MVLRLIAVLAVASCGGSKKQPADPPAHADRPAKAAKPHPIKAAPTCAKPNPKSCPAGEPNINGACPTNGVECSYSASCCGVPVYVCTKHHFQAQFIGCPK